MGKSYCRSAKEIKSRESFNSHTFSVQGIKVDSKKIEVIKNAHPPQNATEVKSLLTMAQYISRFIPGYAAVTAHSILLPFKIPSGNGTLNMNYL